MNDPKLCVLTRVFNNPNDPFFDDAITIIDTLEGLKSKFDLSGGVPFGWRLLKGKAAECFVQRSMREEANYNKHQRAKRDGIGRN